MIVTIYKWCYCYILLFNLCCLYFKFYLCLSASIFTYLLLFCLVSSLCYCFLALIPSMCLLSRLLPTTRGEGMKNWRSPSVSLSFCHKIYFGRGISIQCIEPCLLRVAGTCSVLYTGVFNCQLQFSWDSDVKLAQCFGHKPLLVRQTILPIICLKNKNV